MTKFKFELQIYLLYKRLFYRSIPLMIQSALPVAIFSNLSSSITMKGGTDVSFAPSMDFVKMVIIILIENCNTCTLLKQWFGFTDFISYLQAIWYSLWSPYK